jgi:YgiT-type zinc finger domain-containing protein
MDFNNSICSCGGVRYFIEYDQQWKKDERVFTISKIPAYQCDTCERVFETAMTIISKAHLSTAMNQGGLPNEVEFRRVG